MEKWVKLDNHSLGKLWDKNQAEEQRGRETTFLDITQDFENIHRCLRHRHSPGLVLKRAK